MPIIRYTLRCPYEPKSDYFSETDTFEWTDDPEALVNEIVAPLNKARSYLEEPQLEIVKVEVLNPYVHLHSWRKVSTDRSNLRVHYICDRCGISGFRRLNIVRGPIGAEVTRDETYSKKKFEYCRDPLKQVVKKLSFI